jgi:hypothetical protein
LPTSLFLIVCPSAFHGPEHHSLRRPVSIREAVLYRRFSTVANRNLEPGSPKAGPLTGVRRASLCAAMEFCAGRTWVFHYALGCHTGSKNVQIMHNMDGKKASRAHTKDSVWAPQLRTD